MRGDGPQISEWTKSKNSEAMWLLEVKGTTICFEKWQILQLFELENWKLPSISKSVKVLT